MAALTLFGCVALSATGAHAQSQSQRDGWAADCAALGGQMNWDTGHCDGAGSGSTGGSISGGFNSQQQAMLNLAGQLGSALGSAIRQSFEQSRRQAEVARIQRAWEAEQARQRAALAAEEQRQRNLALLSNMQGAVGLSELKPFESGSGGLKMFTTREMFDTPAAGSGGTTPSTSASIEAGPDAYFAALEAQDAAQRALNARQLELAAGNRLVNEAARALLAQRDLLSKMPVFASQRAAEETKLAEAERHLADATSLRDLAQAQVDLAQQDVARTGTNLAAAKARTNPVIDNATRPPESGTDGYGANADTSVVDLREPEATGAIPDEIFSVVDARGRIGTQFEELPRLEEIEHSPARNAWLRGMDAVANSDYELAAAWFQTAMQRDPTNPALMRMVDGTLFVRDQKRLQAADTTRRLPPTSASPPTHVVDSALQVPDSYDEFASEMMRSEFEEMLLTLSPEELRSLRSPKPDDSETREMLEFLFQPALERSKGVKP